MSFGYTLVTTELVGLAAAEGMDSQVGLLHDLAYGRPSLALDVLEEFRQPIVDRLMPPSTRTHYLLSYDITDDKHRQRLAAMLLDYGDRMQKSVFEADLDADDLATILRRAEALIAEEDSFRIYPLCKHCCDGLILRGRPRVPAEETYEII